MFPNLENPYLEENVSVLPWQEPFFTHHPVFLLDEPTSNLDALNEAEILKKF